jgi:hypothetical protein
MYDKDFVIETLAQLLSNSYGMLENCTGCVIREIDTKNFSMTLKFPKSAVGSKWNLLTLSVNVWDYIDMTLEKESTYKGVKKVKEVYSLENISGDCVRRIFREVTGVETRYPRFA